MQTDTDILNVLQKSAEALTATDRRKNQLLGAMNTVISMASNGERAVGEDALRSALHIIRQFAYDAAYPRNPV